MQGFTVVKGIPHWSIPIHRMPFFMNFQLVKRLLIMGKFSKETPVYSFLLQRERTHVAIHYALPGNTT